MMVEMKKYALASELFSKFIIPFLAAKNHHI
jgi:hypothetical protein